MLGDVYFEADLLPLENGSQRLVLRGELDLNTVSRLEAVAEGLFGKGTTVVVVDLDLLTFCDSSCVRALCELRERSASLGVHFRLVNAQELVRRVFDLSGLADFLES